MKTISKLGLMAALSASLFIASCGGGRYVAERPVEPYYERPVAPYAGAVWVPGNWAYRGHRYVYVKGYYAQPRRNRAYVQGHWQQTQHGYRWQKGYWR
jgi:hypothetical protein